MDVFIFPSLYEGLGMALIDPSGVKNVLFQMQYWKTGNKYPVNWFIFDPQQ